MNRFAEMEAFLAVAEAGGFTAAARTLRLSPSAVSKLVSRLEDRLGARLLQRTTRQVALTAEGRLYLEQARGIVAEIDAVEASVGGAEAEPRGLLRITTAHGFGMAQIMPLIGAFTARYPRVEVQIDFSDHFVDLVTEGYDVGVRLGHVQDEALIARKLAEHRRMLCAAPAYLARHGVPRQPEDLAQHRAIFSSNAPVINEWPLTRADGSVGRFAPPMAVATNSGDAMYRLILEGVGIGNTADFLAHEDIAAGRLVTVLDDRLVSATWPVHAVYPARKHLAAKVRRFVDFLAERFSPRPPWQLG